LGSWRRLLGFGKLIHIEKQLAEIRGPRLVVEFTESLQFTQQVGIAQPMFAFQ